jgi:hypothetical protein
MFDVFDDGCLMRDVVCVAQPETGSTPTQID